MFRFRLIANISSRMQSEWVSKLYPARRVAQRWMGIDLLPVFRPLIS